MRSTSHLRHGGAVAALPSRATRQLSYQILKTAVISWRRVKLLFPAALACLALFSCLAPPAGAAILAAGAYHNLAIRENGTVAAWGANGDGQCNVPAGISGVVAVAGGFAHSLALKADGTVAAWGYNDFGQSNVPGERLYGSLSPVRALLLGN